MNAPLTNPRNVSGMPFTAPGHGITQAMIDAAPGRVLAVYLDPTHASKIRLATALLPATHLTDRVRGIDTLDLHALTGIGSIRDDTGLIEGSDYYLDAANPGHLTATPSGAALLTYLGSAAALGRVAPTGGIATIATQAELLLLPMASLSDGDARSIGRTIYVWHAAMTPEQADGLPTLEPDDKANPGVDAGYWVQQVPELSSSFGDFGTSRTTVHTFGDASSIQLVRFIASDENYSNRKSLLQELEFLHFTQGGNGWTQVNGGATDGDGFVSVEKQFELSAGRHYRVEIFTRFNPDDATAIDWRVESQYSYNVDVINNIRRHDRLTIVDFEIVRSSAADTPAKNALVYPVGNFTALSVNDAGTGADGAVYKLPAVDALQITLPNKAAMNAAEGIWRVRISGDWAALSTQATVLSFTDDTANGVEMGAGLPDDGNEWLDLVFDAANDKWIATSGGDVTLTQVVPTYTLHTEVPANIRLYLIDGTGGSAEGLWRKETATNAPNHIG